MPVCVLIKVYLGPSVMGHDKPDEVSHVWRVDPYTKVGLDVPDSTRLEEYRVSPFDFLKSNRTRSMYEKYPDCFVQQQENVYIPQPE